MSGFTGRSLKYYSFKNSKSFNIFYISNKTTLAAENRFTILHNLFLLDMAIFNKLVIKNDLVKKAAPLFIFMEEFQTN